jgi:hypothetical protein
MSLPIRLLPEARDEFDSAVDWYEQQRPGLGTAFLDRVRDVFARIAANPQLHGIVYQDVRKADGTGIQVRGDIAMGVTIPPVDPAHGADAPGSPGPPISAFRAQQLVNVLAKMEVSSQMGAGTPTLVEGERLCWSVPVWFSEPDRGQVGQAGSLLVDARTGEVLADCESLREIAENARRLAERPAL